MQKEMIPDFSATKIFEDFATGTLNIYQKPHELSDLMHLIQQEFPEVVREINVGTTYKNETIRAFVLGLNFSTNGDQWIDEAKQRPAMLIDGLHHSRELTTTS
jgi:hypothetical protein